MLVVRLCAVLRASGRSCWHDLFVAPGPTHQQLDDRGHLHLFVGVHLPHAGIRAGTDGWRTVNRSVEANGPHQNFVTPRLERGVGAVLRVACGVASGQRAPPTGAAEDRTASRRERTSTAISSMLMLFRHKLSLQGDRRWLSGPMHGLQEYPVWITSELVVSGR